MRCGNTTTTAAILLVLIAAAPLTAGAADTADKAKEQAQTTTQEAKTMVTDSWVTSKTKISLFADERVKGTQVSVDTTKGVVHLRGKVDSAEAKSAASDIAQGVEGVKSVKNDLQVVAPTARKAVDANDSDIAKAVVTRLSKDKQLKKVQESEQALATYREKQNAMSLDDKQNIVTQRLTALNDAMIRARTEKIQKESLYNQVKSISSGTAPDAIPIIAQNPSVQDRKSKLAELQREKVKLLERYGERFLSRIFTDVERARAERRAKSVETYAKRFAAKEACSKALGTGFRSGVFWRDMGVVNLASGRPTMKLTGSPVKLNSANAISTQK